MSDILIKGMKMPKGCSWFDEEGKYHSCRFCFGYICAITGKCIAVSVEGRHPSCPLIPVPEHGRLIDADAVKEILYKKYLGRYRRNDDFNLTCDILDNASTVLEANK